MSVITLRTLPFDLQGQAIVSEAFITACITGARGGKTKSGAIRTLLDATEQPGYHINDIVTGEPYTIGVGAPTFPMLQRVVLPEVLRVIPDELKIEKYNESKKVLKVRGQLGITYIYFLSARFFEAWYGMKLYRAWIDEFPLIKEGMFDELQTRLSDRKGKLFLTGTPQGPNWVYDRIYEPWLDGDQSINFFTWKTIQNPFIDPLYIEQKRSSMPPKYFRRTFEASWETFEGQIYDMVAPRIHYRDPSNYRFVLPDNKASIGDGGENIHIQRVVAGVDWGYTHLGAISILGKDSFGRWWVLEESCDDQVLVTAPKRGGDCWVKRAADLGTKWQVDTFYAGPDRPENIQQFRRAGLKVRPANNDVWNGIQTVAGFAQRGAAIGEPELLILKTCEQHIREIGQYHWKVTVMSGKSLEEPDKINDDAMDALRYAVHSDESRSKFKREVRRRTVA